jgi:hypothetical protein
MKRTRTAAAPARTISFRLDPAAAEALAAEAAARQLSAHELARQHVLTGLGAGGGPAVPAAELAALTAGLEGLREDLARSVKALLMCAGGIEETQATQWVKTCLLQPCSPSPTP